MAKPIKYIAELDYNESKVFLEDLLSPKTSKKEDLLFTNAKKLNFDRR